MSLLMLILFKVNVYGLLLLLCSADVLLHYVTKRCSERRSCLWFVSVSAAVCAELQRREEGCAQP